MEVKVFHLPLLLTRPVRKMRKPTASLPQPKNFPVIRRFLLLLLSCIAVKLSLCFSTTPSSLLTLSLDGHLNFDEVQHVAKDFGNRYQLLPLAVLHPKTVTDIAITIRHVWQMGPHSELTVAARGHGHSLHGQAQAYRGLVVNMECLQSPIIQVHGGKFPYVDVYLTVGGTLSNAGISGQAFRHGPQISNVHQLEVITGTTDAKVKETNSEHTSS